MLEIYLITVSQLYSYLCLTLTFIHSTLSTQFDVFSGLYLPVERQGDADARALDSPAHSLMGAALRADADAAESSALYDRGHRTPGARQPHRVETLAHATSMLVAPHDHHALLAAEPLPYARSPISHLLSLPREQAPRLATHCLSRVFYGSCLAHRSRNKSYSATVFVFLLLALVYATLLFMLSVVFVQLLPLHLFLLTLLLPPLIPLLLPVFALHSLAARSTHTAHTVSVLSLLAALNSFTALGVGVYAHLVLQVVDVEALILPTLMLFVSMLMCPVANAYSAHLLYKEDVLLCRTDYLRLKLHSGASATLE